MSNNINNNSAKPDANLNRQEQAQNVKDALWNSSSGKPWQQAFWNALEGAQIPESLSTGAPIQTEQQADPFASIPEDQRQQVKDDLYNALGQSNLAPEAWNRMWSAGILPGSNTNEPVGQPAPGSQTSATTTNGNGQASGTSSAANTQTTGGQGQTASTGSSQAQTGNSQTGQSTSGAQSQTGATTQASGGTSAQSSGQAGQSSGSTSLQANAQSGTTAGAGTSSSSTTAGNSGASTIASGSTGASTVASGTSGASTVAGGTNGASTVAGGTNGASTVAGGTNGASTVAGGTSGTSGASTVASGTGGTSTATGTSGSTASASPGAVSASANGVLSTASLRDKLGRLLAPRMGDTSGRYLGRGDSFVDPKNPRSDDNKRWDDNKLQQLSVGIATAHQFFPNMSMNDFANMVMSEGAQESSGDTTLNVNNGDPGAGDGFMQVTPQSVVADYRQWGTPIKAPDGSTLVDPHGNIDLGNVAQNVALWGWYTHNAVAAGQSLNERMHPEWHDAPSPVVRDFGNAEWSWLGGPHNDRHGSNAGGYQDYYRRISDYFVQSGFGSRSDFDNLLNTSVSSNLQDIRGASGTSGSSS